MLFVSFIEPPSFSRIDEFSPYTGASPPSIAISSMAAMHRGTLVAEVGTRDDIVLLPIAGIQDVE